MSLPFAAAVFPQELIDRTIDELATTDRLGALQAESRDALIACSVASHSFRPRTIRHLFRRFNPANVGPLDEPDGWDKLAELLSKSTHIVRSVTTIVLQSIGGPQSASRAQATHVMSLFVRVRRVEIWGTALDHWTPTVTGIFADKTITHVLFNSVPFYSFQNFVSCAAACLPNAENLELKSLGMDYDIPSLALTSEFQADTTTLRLPALKTLSCSVSNMSRFFDGVADGTIEIPHLESLKLSYLSMQAACFGPLLQKAPLRALELKDVQFHDSPRTRLPPLSLRPLERLHISHSYFKWLCDSIPLGMSQLQTVTVRFSRPYQGTKPSVFKLFENLATTYLPELETFRLEDYSAKSKRTIAHDCPGLVARGILQWGVEKEVGKVRDRRLRSQAPPRGGGG